MSFPRHRVHGPIVDPSTGAPLVGAQVTFSAPSAVRIMRAPELLGIPLTVTATTDALGMVDVELAQSVGAEGVRPQGWAWRAQVQVPRTGRVVSFEFVVAGPTDLADATDVPEHPDVDLAEWAVTRDEARAAIAALHDGKDGASAYEIAVADGFEGTESEWLESLRGPAGEGGLQLEDIPLAADGLYGTRERGTPGLVALWAGDHRSIVPNDPQYDQAQLEAWAAAAVSVSAFAGALASIPKLDDSLSAHWSPNSTWSAAKISSRVAKIVGTGRPDIPGSMPQDTWEETWRAPIGAEFFSVDGAGVGAWVWRKLPTGWAVTDGDTGWRDVAKITTDSGGTFRVAVRKTPTQTTWRFTGIQEGEPGAGPGAYKAPVNITSGFEPSARLHDNLTFISSLAANVGDGSGSQRGHVTVLCHSPGYFIPSVSLSGQLGRMTAALVSYPGVRAWPSTLPGSVSSINDGSL